VHCECAATRDWQSVNIDRQTERERERERERDLRKYRDRGTSTD